MALHKMTNIVVVLFKCGTGLRGHGMAAYGNIAFVNSRHSPFCNALQNMPRFSKSKRMLDSAT